MEDREHEYLMSVQDELQAHHDAACEAHAMEQEERQAKDCLLYTSPSPRDRQKSRMPSSA